MRAIGSLLIYFISALGILCFLPEVHALYKLKSPKVSYEGDNGRYKRGLTNSVMSHAMRTAGKTGKPLPSSLQLHVDLLCSSNLDTYQIAVYLDQQVTLQCQPCDKSKSKSKGSTVFTWYRQSKYEASEIAVTVESFEGILISDNNDLVINYVLKSDEGKYHCKEGSNYVTSYDVTVVQKPRFNQVYVSLEENPYGEFKGNDSTTVYTVWSPWSKCNTCDLPGERFRIGQCYIQREESDDDIGMPCAVDSVKQDKRHQFRHDEQLIEDCTVTCEGESTGDASPAESKKPTVPPIADRKTIYEEIGLGVAMSCPRGGVGVPVRWQNESIQLSFRNLKTRSEGRVKIDGTNTLHIHELRFSDSAIYSCWMENKLLATVRLVVTGAIVIDKGVKSYLVYSGLSLVVIAILIIAVSVVRNRKNPNMR